jgi:hypothetical protein
MSIIVHPSVFCVCGNCKYEKEISALTKSFANLEAKIMKTAPAQQSIFFKTANVISFAELQQLRPSSEKIMEAQNCGIEIKNPYVVLFVDINDCNNTKWFFTFLDDLKSNRDYLGENNDRNFKYLNIFIRDFSRSMASQLDDEKFYNEYEDFLKHNSLPLSKIFNIIIDNRHEQTGDKSERTDWIFNQLANQLQLLLAPVKNDVIDLTHSGQPTENPQDSSVRYNSLGLSMCGFDDEKVSKWISLKRKTDILQKILGSEELGEDLSLKITRLANELLNKEFENLEQEISDNMFRLSFKLNVQEDTGKFKSKQERNDRDLQTSGLGIITNNILKEIDRKSEDFKSELEESEEESIKESQKKEQYLNDCIKRFTNDLLDSNDTENPLCSGMYGLNALLRPQNLHEVAKRDHNRQKNTLEARKKEVENKIQKTSKNNDDIKSQLDNIKTQLTAIDQKIGEQYGKIKQTKESIELRWFSQNTGNLFIFASGFLFLLLWFLLDFYNYKFYSLLSCIVGFSLVMIAAIRIFRLKFKLKKEEKKLKRLSKDKSLLVDNYINTINEHYKLIIENLIFRRIHDILTGNIAYINRQMDLIERFKDALKNLHASFQNQYEDLQQGDFDMSIIGKEEIEYFCKNNELPFFDNERQLSSYFRNFIENNYDFSYEPFRFLRESRFEEKVTDNEVIKPNKENYKSDVHKYKEIEQFELVTYMSDPNEKQDILYSDVRQGAVGDCYFLASLAAIANKKPGKIREMIDDSCKDYAVCFYDDKLQTHKIYIDKKFWVLGDNDEPIYAKYGSAIENKREIWAMLIEKAWAKINGCDYTNIIGSNSSVRKFDFSLALTGVQAIYETINQTINADDVFNRIKQHIKQKPVVLYSVNEKTEHSDENLVERHAYALIDIEDDKCLIYNPHHSMLTIHKSDLSFNFDTVLYFDFKYQEDSHLKSLFSEYFIRNADNNLLRALDEIINKDIDEKIGNKSLKEILDSNIFNLMIDENKNKKFASLIVEISIPYAYLVSRDMNYEVYLVGDNFLQDHIEQKLKTNGIKHENFKTIATINSDKIGGLLLVRNNLKKDDVTLTNK